jgi:hypothetical protein
LPPGTPTSTLSVITSTISGTFVGEKLLVTASWKASTKRCWRAERKKSLSKCR